ENLVRGGSIRAPAPPMKSLYRELVLSAPLGHTLAFRPGDVLWTCGLGQGRHNVPRFPCKRIWWSGFGRGLSVRSDPARPVSVASILHQVKAESIKHINHMRLCFHRWKRGGNQVEGGIRAVA